MGRPSGPVTPGAANRGWLVSRASQLNAVDMDKVMEEPIDWLWPGVFAKGCISIVSGNPGLGKSQIMASICSIISNGGKWPVTGEKAKTGRAIYVTTEDDIAQDFRPRLYAADASMKRVTFIDSIFRGEKRLSIDLQRDVPDLRNTLDSKPDTEVLILDPLHAFLPRADTNNDAKTRDALIPLGDLAKDYRIAILCVMHHNKSQKERGALMAIGGSVGFTGLARSVVSVYKDFADPTRRIFKCIKNNKASDSFGASFRIEPYSYDRIKTSRVSWESEPVDIDADDLVLGERDCAVSFLKDELVFGPLAAKELEKRAIAQEISMATLRRARTQLQTQGLINKRKEQENWVWFLVDDQLAQLAHPLGEVKPFQPPEQHEQVEQLDVIQTVKLVTETQT